MALWQAYCWWHKLYSSKPSKFNKSQLILSKNTLIGTFKSLSTLSTYLHISSEKWPKMTLWIVIIVHPRSTKTITKYHRKKKRSLRIFFLHSQEIFNFIWLSFSILLKHFIFFSNLNSFGRVLHFQSLQRSTNDFCNSKFCKLFFSKLTKLTEAEISNFFYSRDFHTISLYYFF